MTLSLIYNLLRTIPLRLSPASEAFFENIAMISCLDFPLVSFKKTIENRVD